MQSAIYKGWVRHRRFTPVEHQFRYRLFMMYLDLGELPDLFDRYWLWSARRWAPACFLRRDYMGDPLISLDEAVRNRVQQFEGFRPEGPIRVLTHLRYYGYCFNPVSFYYIFDRTGERVEAMIAEVNNTPWGESHAYVLPAERNLGTSDKLRFRFRKDFHVSPFMEMDVDYDWRLGLPGEHLWVHMDNLKAGTKIFDATMRLDRREINSPALAGTLAQFPFMTGKVIAAIYWQALRLWLKRTPFHPHPTPHKTEADLR